MRYDYYYMHWIIRVHRRNLRRRLFRRSRCSLPHAIICHTYLPCLQRRPCVLQCHRRSNHWHVRPTHVLRSCTNQGVSWPYLQLRHISLHVQRHKRQRLQNGVQSLQFPASSASLVHREKQLRKSRRIIRSPRKCSQCHL